MIRARLIGDVARSLEAGMLDERIAYLTSDAALTSPFVQSFRVREELPADTRGLAKALRERGIGRLEIKKRGVDVDPAVLRKELKLRGDGSATLIVTRVGAKRLAVLPTGSEPGRMALATPGRGPRGREVLAADATTWATFCASRRGWCRGIRPALRNHFRAETSLRGRDITGCVMSQSPCGFSTTLASPSTRTSAAHPSREAV